jgi:hypothetical protein
VVDVEWEDQAPSGRNYPEDQLAGQEDYPSDEANS